MSEELLKYPFSDLPLLYKGNVPINTYHKYCKNVYSQNGEDGILEQLLKELNIEHGTLCDVGAGNGVSPSNTFNLIKNHDFKGIVIESRNHLFRTLCENYKDFPQVSKINGKVYHMAEELLLDTWLTKAQMPEDLDVLSLHVNGEDYNIWNSLKNFKPKIVLLEVNSLRDPMYDELPGKQCTDYKLDLLRENYPHKIASGCSFMSGIKLGMGKGYVPLALTGSNIIFIRFDLTEKLKEFPCTLSNNPYDYMSIYTPIYLQQDRWKTATALIINTAIAAYAHEFNRRDIDIKWINTYLETYLKIYVTV